MVSINLNALQRNHRRTIQITKKCFLFFFLMKFRQNLPKRQLFLWRQLFQQPYSWELESLFSFQKKREKSKLTNNYIHVISGTHESEIKRSHCPATCLVVGGLSPSFDHPNRKSRQLQMHRCSFTLCSIVAHSQFLFPDQTSTPLAPNLQQPINNQGLVAVTSGARAICLILSSGWFFFICKWLIVGRL